MRKELDVNTVFSLQAVAYFTVTSAFVMQISRAKNYTFNFGTSENGIGYYSTTKDGVQVCTLSAFSPGSSSWLIAYYRKSDGTLFKIKVANNEAEEGELFDFYNQLVFKMDDALGQPVFYDASTDENLSEQIPEVPADQVTVSNYNQDPETGIITFDFLIQISQYVIGYRANTTNHDLRIEGKFNSGEKVYQNTVGRSKN